MKRMKQSPLIRKLTILLVIITKSGKMLWIILECEKYMILLSSIMKNIFNVGKAIDKFRKQLLRIFYEIPIVSYTFLYFP